MMAQSRTHDESLSRSRFFASPETPSSNLKSYPTLSASLADSSYFSSHSRKDTSTRKRSRNEAWENESPGSVAPSPAPFANMKYRLANGQETPTAATSQMSAYDASTSDIAYRRGRPYTSVGCNDYFHEHNGDMIGGLPGRNGNGRAPLPGYTPLAPGWSSMVFDLAGKVFDFCTAGTFRGFFAGQGQGYAISTSAPGGNNPISPFESIEESEWLNMPSDAVEHTTVERVAKRSKTIPDNDWVMVRSSSRPASPAQGFRDRPHTSMLPRPSSPALSSQTINVPRSPSSASSATIGRSLSTKRPTTNLRRALSTRTASSAGLRSPVKVSPPRVDFGYRGATTSQANSSNPTQQRNSSAMSPAANSKSKIRLSLATDPMARHQGVQTREQAESPLAKETRQHLDKMRKTELAEDREIMRMNRHLRDLIKQGQEALGTRVEVDFVEEDGW